MTHNDLPAAPPDTATAPDGATVVLMPDRLAAASLREARSIDVALAAGGAVSAYDIDIDHRGLTCTVEVADKEWGGAARRFQVRRFYPWPAIGHITITDVKSGDGPF